VEYERAKAYIETEAARLRERVDAKEVNLLAVPGLMRSQADYAGDSFAAANSLYIHGMRKFGDKSP
jgi:hypothetical protein